MRLKALQPLDKVTNVINTPSSTWENHSFPGRHGPPICGPPICPMLLCETLEYCSAPAALTPTPFLPTCSLLLFSWLRYCVQFFLLCKSNKRSKIWALPISSLSSLGMVSLAESDVLPPNWQWKRCKSHEAIMTAMKSVSGLAETYMVLAICHWWAMQNCSTGRSCALIFFERVNRIVITGWWQREFATVNVSRSIFWHHCGSSSILNCLSCLLVVHRRCARLATWELVCTCSHLRC